MAFHDAACRVDAKKDITSITIDVSLTLTVTTDTAEDGSYAITTETTNASDTFTRLRTSDLRGKYYGVSDFNGYYLLVEASSGTYPTLTFNKLTNPNCKDDNENFLIEFSEFTTYPNGLFNEEWQPSHTLIDNYRAAAPGAAKAVALAALKAEWMSHSVWKPGYFMLLSPPCCPCKIQILQYAVVHTDATECFGTQYDGIGGVFPDAASTYKDWTNVIPNLVTRNCKSELGQSGGGRFDEEDDESTPATFAVTSIVTGDDDHDAEVEIQVNETGAPQVRVEYSWTSADGDIYVFYLSAGTYPGGTQTADIVLHALNGDDGSTYSGSELTAWRAKMAALSASCFRLTTGTKSDGELGVWRIGFIGRYGRIPVALPAYFAAFTHHFDPDDQGAEIKVVRYPWGGSSGYSDYLDFNNETYHTSGSVSRLFVVPEYSTGLYPLGSQVQDPHVSNFLNVARCMSDAGASWSRTFDTTYDAGAETHHRVGHITYTW